jgi:hypothetical protein
MSLIEKYILKIENPANISDALAASGPYTLRMAFEMDKTVQALIERGDEAGNLILKQIKNRGKKRIDDVSMACFCYILEKTGFRKSVPELGALLTETREIRKRGEESFTKYFAIHAAKVLAKHPGLKTNLAYSDDEIMKSVRRIKSMERKR